MFPEVMVKEEVGFFFLSQGPCALAYNFWVCGYVGDIFSGHTGPLPQIYFRESDWSPAVEAGIFLGTG